VEENAPGVVFLVSDDAYEARRGRSPSRRRTSYFAEGPAMKAVMFEKHGGTEVLQYRDDLPIPKIGPREVLLRIKAAAMNYNCIWARQGLPGMDFKLPHINGTDGAGVVVEVGSEVTTVKVGDEVVVNGAFSCGDCVECIRGVPMFCPHWRIWGFETGPNKGAEAEYAAVPARNCIPKPPNTSFAEIAAITNVLATVWRMLVTRARMQAGDTVLIWGATGGIGSAAIQLCRVFGAKTIAIVSSAEKAKVAAELGADYVINRTEQRVTREVMNITNKRGVDIVFEHSGAATWETSTYCLRWGGTIVTCGATTGFKAPLDIRFLWTKQQNYLGSHFASISETVDALRFVKSGQIKAVINEIMPLKDVVRGHEMLEKGEVIGKIVLIPE
jgi:NADPH2:quinone reductase